MSEAKLISCSSLVSLPIASQYELLGPFRQVLDIVDRIHQVHDRGRVSVEFRSRATPRAEYVYHPRRPQVEPRIVLGRPLAEPRMTFLHELGHFLDNRLLHVLSDAFASEYEACFQPLVDAWRRSESVKRANQLLFSPARPRIFLSVSDRRFLRYAIENRELFARSYAQYIAVKSGDMALGMELERRCADREKVGPFSIRMQWEQREFEPIMHAIDVLLSGKGWL